MAHSLSIENPSYSPLPCKFLCGTIFLCVVSCETGRYKMAGVVVNSDSDLSGVLPQGQIHALYESSDRLVTTPHPTTPVSCAKKLLN